MSDFLTNLAARALAPPTLRPRTPSRFEPAGVAGAPEPWEEESEPHRARELHRATEPGEAAASPETLAEPAPERTPHDEVIRERTREVLHERTHSNAEHHEVTREIRVSPSPEAAPSRRPLPVITQQQRGSAPERTRADHAPETRVDLRERERTLPAIPPQARATARIHRDSSPASRALAPKNREGTQTAAEPVIHVSIGRVEVRAVTATAVARSPRRGPAMSIDDYVARKKAKERR